MFADGLMQRERYKWKWGFSYSMEDDELTICRLSLAVNDNNILLLDALTVCNCIALLSYLGHNREHKHFTVVLSCMVFRI